MASGQSVTITSAYSTWSAFSGNVTDTATVSAASAGSNAANNTASKTTNVAQQAGLQARTAPVG